MKTIWLTGSDASPPIRNWMLFSFTDVCPLKSNGNSLNITFESSVDCSSPATLITFEWFTMPANNLTSFYQVLTSLSKSKWAPLSE